MEDGEDEDDLFVIGLIDAIDRNDLRAIRPNVDFTFQIATPSSGEREYSVELKKADVKLESYNRPPGRAPMTTDDLRRYIIHHSVKNLSFVFKNPPASEIILPTSPFYWFTVRFGTHAIQELPKYHMFDPGSTKTLACASFELKDPKKHYQLFVVLHFNILVNGFSLKKVVVNCII